MARQVDRLSRAAHAFHRYAHHPLCDRYAGELVSLGRGTRICRGCAFALVGGLLGLAVGVSLRLAWGPERWLWPAVLLAGVTLLRRRLPKLVTRALPAAGLSLAAIAGGWPVTLAVATLGSGALLRYRWRQPDRSPCRTCPERTLEICRGFWPIVRRERAFQRLAQRVLNPGPHLKAAPIDSPGSAPL